MIFRNFFKRKNPEGDFRDRLVDAMWGEWDSPLSASEYRSKNGWGQKHPLWCGQLVAVAARKAGIDPFYANKIIPSTYRLASLKYNDRSFYGERTPLRDVPSDEIKPGHIVCVETSRGKPYGDHVVVPVKIVGDRLICIEGNARGLNRDGQWSPYRSVVVQVRHRDDVRAAYEVPKSALK